MLSQVELEWLSTICNTHYSIDTYAKKLFIKGDEAGYLKLKNSLSLYFTIQQILVQPDKRYDQLLGFYFTSGQFDFPKSSESSHGIMIRNWSCLIKISPHLFHWKMLMAKFIWRVFMMI